MTRAMDRDRTHQIINIKGIIGPIRDTLLVICQLGATITILLRCGSLISIKSNVSSTYVALKECCVSTTFKIFLLRTLVIFLLQYVCPQDGMSTVTGFTVTS